MEDSTTEVTRVSVNKKIDDFAEGDLEHATEILSALWEIVSKDGDITVPSNTSPAVSPLLFRLPSAILTPHNQVATVTSPARWGSVKIALIKSIREGILFDRKYWARRSKTGDTLKPVYFSSIIMGDKVEQLNNCASKPNREFLEALRVSSGELHRGSERSRQRSRGRHQR